MSEQMSAAERASKASSAEQVNVRAEERMSQYFTRRHHFTHCVTAPFIKHSFSLSLDIRILLSSRAPSVRHWHHCTSFFSISLPPFIFQSVRHDVFLFTPKSFHLSVSYLASSVYHSVCLCFFSLPIIPIYLPNMYV